MPNATPEQITTFIERWERSGAAERANHQLFLSELCDLLDAPTTTATRTGHGIRGTAGFDRALERAYHQGRGYITALPPDEGRPPFLIICDVGATIDLYAEFTGTGGHYERFPDPVSHRITLRDLHRPEIRDCLRRVWLDPHSLDPSKHAAAVTREVAKALAELGKSLEADGHDPQIVARFLQRCLFTMFAEDIGLLPSESFLNLLMETKNSPAAFPVLIEGLWRDMATGAASPNMTSVWPDGRQEHPCRCRSWS